MNTTATAAANTDRFGFPLVTCRRCGGSGRYSFNRMHGSTCYGCGGTGWAHASKRVAEAYVAYRAACKKAVRPTIGELEAGDEVTRDHDFDVRPLEGATWRTVAAIVPLPLICGSGRAGSSVWAVARYLITWSDGEVEQVDGHFCVARRGRKVPVAPFLEQAGCR